MAMKLKEPCPQCRHKEWKWCLKHKNIYFSKINQTVTSVTKLCRKCRKAANKITL